MPLYERSANKEGPGDDSGAYAIQVHLVAPPLVCWGLQRLVQTAGTQFLLVSCSANLQEAMATLERQPPDVVLLDLDDGYCVDDISHLYDRTRVKVLALTSSTDARLLDGVLSAGARGVLQKREAPGVLLKALEAVGRGELFANAAPAESVLAPGMGRMPQARDPEANKIASLTMRERQTIAAVTADASAPVKVIASRLCISEHTLRNHLTSIYSKLGVPGRLALYAYANQYRLAATSVRGREAG